MIKKKIKKNESKNKKLIKSCPICDCNKLIKIFSEKWNKSSFVKCTKCKLIFQNPLEKINKTISRYNRNYFTYELENQNNFFNLIKKTLDDFDIFKIIPQNSSVLEIGSATGLFLKYINEAGYKSIGIEVCKESVLYGKKNFKVDLRHGKLEDIKLKNNSFDFIHFSHLLEHLNDPEDFLKRINKLLKNDGIALITTPNSSGLFSKLYKESWRCIVDDHLFIFNIKNLSRLLKKLNFKIIKVKTWGSIPKGNTFNFLKMFFDSFVKITGSGDVMAFLVKKS